MVGQHHAGNCVHGGSGLLLECSGHARNVDFARSRPPDLTQRIGLPKRVTGDDQVRDHGQRHHACGAHAGGQCELDGPGLTFEHRGPVDRFMRKFCRVGAKNLRSAAGTLEAHLQRGRR